MSSILNAFKICEQIPETIKTSIKSFYVFNNYSDKNENIIFVTEEDGVYGLGENEFGVLGLGHKNEVMISTEIEELSDENITDLYNGLGFVLGRTEDNTVFGWGRNESGQLGRGFRCNNLLKPEQIDFFENPKIEELSCGKSHTLVLLSNGYLYGWGSNSSGQLISKNIGVINEPIKVTINGRKDNKFKHIYCYYESSFATTTDGRLISWGNNDCKILGQTRDSWICNPRVVDLFGVIDVSFIGVNSYFLTSDGFLHFCGEYQENDKEFVQNLPKRMNSFEINIRDLFGDICCDSENRFYVLKVNKLEEIKDRSCESFYESIVNRFQITPQMVHISDEDLDESSMLGQLNEDRAEQRKVREQDATARIRCDSDQLEEQTPKQKRQQIYEITDEKANKALLEVKRLSDSLNYEQGLRKSMEQLITQLQARLDEVISKVEFQDRKEHEKLERKFKSLLSLELDSLEEK